MGMYDPKPQMAPRETCPEGLWGARLYAIVDLGTHEDTYQGVTSLKRKLYLGWELECRMSNGDMAGKPFVMGKEYTITNGNYKDKAGNPIPYISKNSNLKKLLKSWLKWPDDKCKLQNFKELVGQVASLNVENKDSEKHPGQRVAWISTILPGKSTIPPENEPMLYAIEEGESEAFQKLYPWMQEKIKRSCEFTKTPIPDSAKRVELDAAGNMDEDLPF